MNATQKDISQLIREVFIYIQAEDRRLSQQFDLTLLQLWTLIHLEDPAGLSPGTLARLVLCDKSCMTRLIDELEARELVVRQQGKDRRSLLIALTEQGRMVRASILSAQKEHLSASTQPLDETDIQEARSILGRFLNTLSATQS